MIAIIRSLLFYVVFYGASVGYVLVALLSLPAGGRWVLALGRSWARFHRGCAQWLLGIRVRVEGDLPKEPVLLAFRHESFFDAIDLPCLLDRPVVFAKEELLRIPGWGRLARRYGLIPVARDKGAAGLRAMLAAVRAVDDPTRPLVIFPEGTRVPHGRRAKLQAGFAAVYKLLGLPVTPVALDSGPLYHRRWKRSGTITIRFGMPIPPGLPRQEMEEQVAAAINALNSAMPE